MRRSDAIPHLSYASVEALLLEASQESPVRRTVEGWGRTVAGTVAGALVSYLAGSGMPCRAGTWDGSLLNLPPSVCTTGAGVQVGGTRILGLSACPTYTRPIPFAEHHRGQAEGAVGRGGGRAHIRQNCGQLVCCA